MNSDDGGLPREEISPYLVYRLSGDEMECAIWKLSEGERALSLFTTQETAEAYLTQTLLGDGWMVYQPNRADLLEILKQSESSGIYLAVLDPDDKQGKRLFDLREISMTGPDLA